AITVDGTNCTLTDAITAANTDTATGGCKAGNGTDTLQLSAATYTLKTIDNNTDGPNGLPSVTSAITINGATSGSTIRRSGAASTPSFRLFRIAADGQLTLHRIKIQTGRSLFIDTEPLSSQSSPFKVSPHFCRRASAEWRNAAA
ncbi:MAG: hypothetical protein ACU837_13105, partial [Gammaproteobacteria bacterium]